MKFYVDQEEVFDLPKWKQDVIKNDIHADEFDADMKRRVAYIISHKFDRCFERLEKEWIEKLRSDPSVTSIPTDKQAFVELVMARPDYKDRKVKDVEAKARLGS